MLDRQTARHGARSWRDTGGQAGIGGVRHGVEIDAGAAHHGRGNPSIVGSATHGSSLTLRRATGGSLDLPWRRPGRILDQAGTQAAPGEPVERMTGGAGLAVRATGGDEIGERLLRRPVAVQQLERLAIVGADPTSRRGAPVSGR